MSQIVVIIIPNIMSSTNSESHDSHSFVNNAKKAEKPFKILQKMLNRIKLSLLKHEKAFCVLCLLAHDLFYKHTTCLSAHYVFAIL